MTVKRFVSQVELPNGEHLYAVCTGDPNDRTSVRTTPILAVSAEECQAFINDLERARREGYGEGYRDGLIRGGELAAKERGAELQKSFDEEKEDLLLQAKFGGEEFCKGLLASIKSELRGRGYTPAPKAAGPCRQQEALPLHDAGLAANTGGSAPDGDADEALNGSDLEL